MRRPVIAIFLLSALGVSPVLAQQFSILYHETLDDAALAPAVALVGVAKPQATFLSFRAFGRQFDLALERNERLLSGLSAAAPDIELYRGELTGVTGSWARIARRGIEVSGVIFDGTELYVLEPRYAIAGLLAAPSASGGATIVYRWSDTTGALVDGLRDPSEQDRTAAVTLLEHMKTTAAASVPKQIDVALVADYEFSQQFGARAPDEMLAIANIVDGIFATQLGIFIAVPEINVYSSSADPFSATAPASLLDELENHKFNTPVLRTRGLAHLFTARNLEEPQGYENQIVGFANFGVVCDARYGVGLTQATLGIGVSGLIAAHEVGHNFGAPHDAETQSPCSHAPRGFLMEPTLSFSDTFSQCSLEQMAPEISAATCLTALAPNDVSLRFGAVPASVPYAADFTAEVIVDSAAGNDSRGVALDLTVAGASVRNLHAPGDWTCNRLSTPVRCAIQALPQARSDTMRLTLQSSTSAPSLGADITAANDPNPLNNSIDHAFTLDPTVDLVALMTPPHLELHPGEEHVVSAVVRNERFATATGVNARITLGHIYDMLEIVPSSGSCVQSESLVLVYNCDLGTIPVAEARTVGVRLRIHDPLQSVAGWESSHLSVQAMANELEAAPNDNGRIATIIGAEAIVDIATSIEGPTELLLGNVGQYSVSYTNNGPETATDVLLKFEHLVDFDVAIESATGAGACRTEWAWQIWCRSPVLLPGQSVALGVSVRPNVNGLHELRVSTSRREWDRHSFNNAEQLRLEVVDAVPPTPSEPPETPLPPTTSTPPAAPAPTSPPPSTPATSGGGGGSSDTLWLAWLLAAAALRRRRV